MRTKSLIKKTSPHDKMWIERHKKAYLKEINNEPLRGKKAHITMRYEKKYGINFKDLIKQEQKTIKKERKKELKHKVIHFESFNYKPFTQRMRELEAENKMYKRKLKIK